MPEIDQTTLQAENLRDPSWRSRRGLPLRWMPFDGETLQTSPPAPHQTFTLTYLEAPRPMGENANTPDPRIPTIHHPHLTLAALYHLLIQDGDTQDLAAAERFFLAFTSLIRGNLGDRTYLPPSRRT